VSNTHDDPVPSIRKKLEPAGLGCLAPSVGKSTELVVPAIQVFPSRSRTIPAMESCPVPAKRVAYLRAGVWDHTLPANKGRPSKTAAARRNVRLTLQSWHEHVFFILEFPM